MPPKEYFADQLASGTAVASKMALWWPRHSHASMELLAATAESRGDMQRLEKSSIAFAEEWEMAVPSSQARRAGAEVGLMREHAILEVDLIYAIMTGHSSTVARIAERMIDNVKVQVTRYAHAMPSFPETRFGYLLHEHVDLFLQSVQSRFDRDVGRALKCAREMDGNSVALAALTAEWF